MNKSLHDIVSANEEVIQLIKDKHPLIPFDAWYFHDGIVENMNFVMYCKENKTIRLMLRGNDYNKFIEKVKQALLKDE